MACTVILQEEQVPREILSEATALHLLSGRPPARGGHSQREGEA